MRFFEFLLLSYYHLHFVAFIYLCNILAWLSNYVLQLFNDFGLKNSTTFIVIDWGKTQLNWNFQSISAWKLYCLRSTCQRGCPEGDQSRWWHQFGNDRHWNIWFFLYCNWVTNIGLKTCYCAAVVGLSLVSLPLLTCQMSFMGVCQTISRWPRSCRVSEIIIMVMEWWKFSKPLLIAEGWLGL